MREEDLIDKFGAVVDDIIKEEHVGMVIDFPAGSMDPDIKSSFEKMGEGRSIFELYILLHAIKKSIENILSLGYMDETKKAEMLDSILEIIRNDVLKEAAGE